MALTREYAAQWMRTYERRDPVTHGDKRVIVCVGPAHSEQAPGMNLTFGVVESEAIGWVLSCDEAEKFFNHVTEAYIAMLEGEMKEATS